jgi:hypothetical protein
MRINSKFRRLNSFPDIQAGRIAAFQDWILSCMRVRDWHLIESTKLSCTLMLVVFTVELICHDLRKNVPFTKAKTAD